MAILIYDSRRPWWIGGSDEGSEGEWYWINSQQPVEDFVWRSDMPAGGTDNNYLCLWFGGYLGLDCSNEQTGLSPICHGNPY